jgi:hypothetical protein
MVAVYSEVIIIPQEWCARPGVGDGYVSAVQSSITSFAASCAAVFSDRHLPGSNGAEMRDSWRSHDAEMSRRSIYSHGTVHGIPLYISNLNITATST